MNTMLSHSAFQVPSVRHFLRSVADDLGNRRSVLVLLPLGIAPEKIRSQVRARLWERELRLGEVLLTDMSDEHPPILALHEALGLDWSSSDAPRTIPNFMDNEALPDILHLEGMEDLSDAAIENWMTFFSEWALHSQKLADQGTLATALCSVVPATALVPAIPKSSLHLTLRWWWGFPSAIEHRLLCRLESGFGNTDIAVRWREHILPSLASGDTCLADYLWDRIYSDFDDLIKHLRRYCEYMNWTSEQLREWCMESSSVPSDNCQNSLSPPPGLRKLWANGMLSHTPEYGMELHCSALAILDRVEEISHRLWRAQAEFLLPLIDTARLTICRHFNRLYGRDWPLRWESPISQEELEAVQENPLSCQWGHLKKLIRTHLPFSERRWLSLVTRAHRIRNELAHYRPITFEDFEICWREIRQVNPGGRVFRV